MKMNFNERLKPNTEFIVYVPMRLSEDHREVLNQLYLPILQADVMMAYFYLHESSNHFEPLSRRFHKEIMDALSIPLSEFMKTLEKLEGIGLVRTYVSNEAHEDLFIYELLSPMSAEAFLKDPMMSMYLYGKIGPEQFKVKKNRLSYPTLPSNVSDVTKKFTEVFRHAEQHSFVTPQEDFRKDVISTGANVDMDDFDFEVLYTHLKGTKIDKKFFNREVRMLIVKLSVLFNLNAYDMKKILLNSTNQYRGIDKEKLKYEARSYYQKEYNQPLPSLISDNEKEILQTSNEEAGNSVDGYITALNYINPLDRLNDLRSYSPSDTDIKLVTDIIASTHLTNGVINVLLEYVYQIQEGELPVPYTMKIARDWQTKGYQTAEEAYQSVVDYKREQEKRRTKRNPKLREGEKKPYWMDKEKTEDSKPVDYSDQKTAKDDPELQRMINDFRKN
jgi:replication initiation and membrane attachment protein